MFCFFRSYIAENFNYVFDGVIYAVFVSLGFAALENIEFIAENCPSHGDPKEALDMVGLSDRAGSYPSAMSGGQQQRVSIARALAGDPSVILADEPTGALDSRTGREVLAFLKQLNQEGNTVVLITHDNSIAVKADRIIRLQDGKVIYDGDARDPQAVVQPSVADDEEVTA